MYQVLSHQHSASLPEHGRGKEGKTRKVWRKEMGGTKESAAVLQMALSWPGRKGPPGCAESLLYLQVVQWNVISTAVWIQVGLISPAPKWEGGLCFWVAPGLTLPKAKLRHAPVYSVLPLAHFLCLGIEQQVRKNGIPGLSLWWGWFLDKWAVSEVCLKCKDTQECWCKLKVWRAEEKSQLVPVSPLCCWYVMQLAQDWIMHSTFSFLMDRMGRKRKGKKIQLLQWTRFIWGRAGRIFIG